MGEASAKFTPVFSVVFLKNGLLAMLHIVLALLLFQIQIDGSKTNYNTRQRKM